MKEIRKNQILIINNSNYNTTGYYDTDAELRTYIETFPFVFTKNKNWREENWEYNLNGNLLTKYTYLKDKNILKTSESIKDTKLDSVVFFPTADKDHFSFELCLGNIESYIQRQTSRSNNTNQHNLDSYSYYREVLTAAETSSLETATYGTYDYIWMEDETLNFSNIGKHPIENLTPLEFDLNADETGIDVLNPQSFVGSNLFNKNIVHLTPEKIQEVIDANPNKVLKMWDLKNLYRGTTPTQYNLVSKKISAFAKGYKIALARMKVKTFSPTNFEKIDSYFYFYVTNIPLRNYNKYSKARNFFKFVIEKSNFCDGAYFFDKETFDKKMKERFGTNTMYSNMLGKIFENTSFELNQLKMNANTQETSFDPSVFSVYTSVKQAKENPVYSSYAKTKTKLQEFETKVNDLSSVKSTIDSKISRLKVKIQNYENEIKSLNENLVEKTRKKKEITVNLPNYIKAKESLTEKIKKQEKEYNSYLTAITDSAVLGTNSYAKNFAKQGIIIDKVEYIENQTLKTLTNDHKIILSSLKTNSDIQFKCIYFRILKPVTIYVDRAEKGENCRKIIGGPYSVRVDESNLYISLLSSASVFGFDFNNKSLWVHPHTPNINTHNCRNPQQFFDMILNSERRACLGEASPAIYTAFKQKDIRQIIIAAMAWVTNANSTDAWGKNQKHFQTLSELKDSSTMITNDFIKNQNIVNRLQDPEEMFNLLSDSLEQEQQEIQQQEDEEVNQTQQNELPQINFSLRRPGVENYRPYNQNQEQ